MTIDKLIVTIFGIAGFLFTYWFFLGGKKEKEVIAGKSIDIVVEGGYKPDRIVAKQGSLVTINFIRKDANPCLEEVVLSEFKIRRFLPLKEKVSITITPKKKGDFHFSCGMGMFHGKIIVK